MRFYLSPQSIDHKKGLAEIRNKGEIHHIKDVFRQKKGCGITVFDGTGMEYKGVIEQITPYRIQIKINSVIEQKRAEPSFKIILYQAIPKRGKMGLIVEKATELGVSGIVPMLTDRTNRIHRDDRKTERWQRIAREASKQCGRVVPPYISDIMTFRECLQDARDGDLLILAALDENSIPIKDVLQNRRADRMLVFIGPEGDFTPSEISKARANAFNVCSLGPRVLKVETAALFLISCLNYEYN